MFLSNIFVFFLGVYLHSKNEYSGLAVVPGTHKGNISAPQSMRQQQTLQEFVKQPVAKAGDVTTPAILVDTE